MSFATIVTLIIVWPRAHNLVLGGGMEAYSDQGRLQQWEAGIPYIESNPFTGQGFALGGYALELKGLISIDSYVLSLLIETGVFGLMFFAGILLLPIWHSLRSYLSDQSQSGAVAGALACSFIAFTVNRLVLSQRENHMLIFSLLAVVIVLSYESYRKSLPKLAGYRSQEKPYFRADGPGLGRA
jgi:O-antigen ligase